MHFHEVGAVDAMVDIVCAAVGAEALAVDEIICSPLNVGGGTVKCAHGTIPRTGSGNGRVTRRCAGVFFRPADGVGHAHGRGDRENAGFTLRGVSRDED